VSFCSSSILLVGSFDLKNRLPDNLYCVVGDAKHCSINRVSVLRIAWPAQCIYHICECTCTLARLIHCIEYAR